MQTRPALQLSAQRAELQNNSYPTPMRQGNVFMNGREQDERFFFASAYVAQEDNLVPTNTVIASASAQFAKPNYILG